MRRTIFWRRLDLPGHEIAHLEESRSGWTLRGTAMFLHESGPARLDYVVECDPGFVTRSALILGEAGDRVIDLTVKVDGNRRWTLNDEACPAVDGCIDIDLGFSPSTNLLPIRRLALEVGGTAAVNAAWLPFPALTFQLLPQFYKREGERSWLYESAGGRFKRTIEVDDAGLVTDYPGIWTLEKA